MGLFTPSKDWGNVMIELGVGDGDGWGAEGSWGDLHGSVPWPSWRREIVGDKDVNCVVK